MNITLTNLQSRSESARIQSWSRTIHQRGYTGSSNSNLSTWTVALTSLLSSNQEHHHPKLMDFIDMSILEQSILETLRRNEVNAIWPCIMIYHSPSYMLYNSWHESFYHSWQSVLYYIVNIHGCQTYLREILEIHEGLCFKEKEYIPVAEGVPCGHIHLHCSETISRNLGIFST